MMCTGKDSLIQSMIYVGYVSQLLRDERILQIFIQRDITDLGLNLC